MRRGVLHHHERGAAPLAAERDSLGDAHGDQQDWREGADLAIGRQQADQEGRQPIVVSVATRTALRPTRSPKWPHNTPPTGRATKPTAKVANAANVPASGLDEGKNSLPKTAPPLRRR